MGGVLVHLVVCVRVSALLLGLPGLCFAFGSYLPGWGALLFLCLACASLPSWYAKFNAH